MFEGQVAYYLNKYLGTYVSGIDSQSLKISVWKGDVVLTNLRLKPEALGVLDLPIEVQSGLVGSLRLKVPWARLGSEPVVLELDRIYVLAKPNSNFHRRKEDDESAEEREREAKAARVAEAELQWLQGQASGEEADGKEPGEEGEPKQRGRLKAYIDTILGNIVLQISNLHIRYEDQQSYAAHPFAMGVTLDHISAHTVDDLGAKTFATSNALQNLRKLMQLQRLSVYFDVDMKPWQPNQPWKQLPLEAWDSWFLAGVGSAAAASSGTAAGRQLVLRPVDGQLSYLRRQVEESRRLHLSSQEACLSLKDINVHLTQPQYCSTIRLLEALSAFQARRPYAHLRPTSAIRRGSAAQWWQYAMRAAGKRYPSALSWPAVRRLAEVRRGYLPLYRRLLQEGAAAAEDARIQEWDRELPEVTILLFRKICHTKVMQEKKMQKHLQDVKKQQKEQRSQASSWTSWLFGSSSAAAAAGPGDAGEAEGKGEQQQPEAMSMKSELGASERQKLEELVAAQVVDEQQADSGDPWNLLFDFQLKVATMALALEGDGGEQVAFAFIQGMASGARLYPVARHFLLSLESMGVDTVHGPLLTTGSFAASDVAVREAGGLCADAWGLQPGRAALAARVVLSPQDASADTVVGVHLAPSFVTYRAQAVEAVQGFFTSSEMVDLTALTVQAAARAAELREVAEQQLQAAWAQKPTVALNLHLVGPKVAVPVDDHPPANLQGAAGPLGQWHGAPAGRRSGHTTTLVLDFGTLMLRSDPGQAALLSPEERAVYECFELVTAEFAAYLMQGPFSWPSPASLSQLASGGSSSGEPSKDTPADEPPIITLLKRSSDDGAAVVPLLDRCGTQSSLHAAKAAHPTLPRLRLHLLLPSLRFHCSPDRLNRLFHVLRAALPQPSAAGNAGAPGSAVQMEQPWAGSAEHAAEMAVFSWEGLGGRDGVWQQRWVSLWRGTLYVLPERGSSEILRSLPLWGGRTLFPVRPDIVSGTQHVLALAPAHVAPVRVAEEPSALLLRLASSAQQAQWRRWLTAAKRQMELVAGTHSDLQGNAAMEKLQLAPSDTQSVSHTASDAPGGDDAASSHAPEGAAGANLLEMLEVKAQLGEFCIFVGGRAMHGVWPAAVIPEPAASAYAELPDSASSPFAAADETEAHGAEVDLLAVRAEGALISFAHGSSGSAFHSTLHEFAMEDLLVGPRNPAVRYLARSFPLQEGTGGRALERPSAGASSGRLAGPGSSATSCDIKPVGCVADDGAAEGSSEEGRQRSESVGTLAMLQLLKADAEREEGVEDLVSFSVRLWNAGSPSYNNVDCELQLQLAELFFTCNRPTVAALMSLAQDLEPVPAAAPPPSARQAVAAAAAEDGSEHLDVAALPRLSERGGLAGGEPVVRRAGGSLRTVVRVVAEMRQLAVVFPYEGCGSSSLGHASMQQLRSTLDVHPETLQLTATLGNAVLFDGALDKGNRYRNVFDYREEAEASLIEVAFTSHTAAEARQNPRTPDGLPFNTLRARMSGVTIVLLYRFLSEVLTYIDDLFELRPPPLLPARDDGAAATGPDAPPPGPAAGVGGSGQAGVPFIVLLDVDMDAPELEMPRTSESPDSVDLDLGSLHISNRVVQQGGASLQDPAAALVDVIDIRLSQFRAHVLSRGTPGADLIRDIGNGVTLEVRRPLRDASAALPSLQVAVQIPYVRGVVTNEEYRFMTAVASSNLAEPLRIPEAAARLHTVLARGEASDAPASPAAAALASGSAWDGAASSPQARSSTAGGAVPAAARRPEAGEGSAVRFSVRIGHAEVELQTLSKGHEAPQPLGKVQLEDLWVTYRTTRGGDTFLTLCLPRCEAMDLRPNTPPLYCMVLSTSADPSAVGSAAEELPPASLLLLEYESRQAGAHQKLQLRLQRPTLVAETGFALAMLQFVVPDLSLGGDCNDYFETRDVHMPVSGPLQAEADLWLSPETRLLADAPGCREFVYDGQGHALVLPEGVAAEDQLPLIHIGQDAVLRLENVTLVNADSLAGCLQLQPGARLLLPRASPADAEHGSSAHLDAVPPLPALQPAAARRSMGQQGPYGAALEHRLASSTLSEPGVLLSPLASSSLGGPYARDSRSPQPATEQQQAAVLEVSFAAVGIGLHVLDTAASQAAAAAAEADAASASGGEPAEELGVRMLCLYVDMEGSLKQHEELGGSSRRSGQLQLQGMRCDSRFVGLGGSGSGGGSGVEAKATTAHLQRSRSQIQGKVLEPCNVKVEFALSLEQTDLRIHVTDLLLNLSPDVLQLVLDLQHGLLAPLSLPSADQPLARCSAFRLVKTFCIGPAVHLPLPPRSDQAPCGALHHQVSVWRPLPPPGFGLLGDVIHTGTSPPLHQVVAVALRSGLVAYPQRFHLAWLQSGTAVWQPQPPPGFCALGCIATTGNSSTAPPPLTAMVCVHHTCLVEAPLGQCVDVCVAPHRSGSSSAPAATGGALRLWCVDNAAASFIVSAVSASRPPAQACLDLRSPLGVPPSALLHSSSHAASAKTAEGTPPQQVEERESKLAVMRSAGSYRSFCKYRRERRKILREVAAGHSHMLVSEFERIWWNRGLLASLADQAVSIWAPIVPAGYVCLGHCVERGYTPPKTALLLAEDSQLDAAGRSREHDSGWPLLMQPVDFQLIWTSSEGRSRKLHIWQPLPPKGYLAMGHVATRSGRKPEPSVVRCVRSDAVVPFASEPEAVPFAQLHSSRVRHESLPLGVWMGDERVRTFFAAPGAGARPRRHQLLQLKMLMAEPAHGDPESGAPQGGRRSEPAGPPSLMVKLETGSMVLQLRDALRMPLLELECGGAVATLHTLEPGLTQAFADLQVEACSYNAYLQAWEPVLEPWKLLLHYESNSSFRARRGVGPGTHLRAASTSDCVQLMLAYAALDQVLSAYTSWTALSQRSASSRMQQLAVADVGAALTVVDNSLGRAAEMQLDFGMHVRTERLAEGGSNKLVQPMQLPPPRKPDRPQLSAAAPLVLAVALQTVAPLPPEAVPGTSELHLQLALELDASAAGAGPAPPDLRLAARTRSVLPEQRPGGGTAAWHEVLLVPLPEEFVSPLFDAYNKHRSLHSRVRKAEASCPRTALVFSLLDREADLDAAPKVLATGRADVPFGWLLQQLHSAALKHSGQAGAAAAAAAAAAGSRPEAVPESSQILPIRVPLQAGGHGAPGLQLAAEVQMKRLHRRAGQLKGYASHAAGGDQAWKRTVGRRALKLQLPDDSSSDAAEEAWVPISTAAHVSKAQGLGLSRAQRGPGGGRPEGARHWAVTGVPVGEGVAIEEGFSGGLRHELLRSLCQVVNATDIELEVSVMERVEADFMLVPREEPAGGFGPPPSRSAGAPGEVLEVEVFENVRYIPLRGWTANGLLPTDPRHYSDDRRIRRDRSFSTFPLKPLPSGWEWEGAWMVEKGAHTDSNGWLYGIHFGQLTWPPSGTSAAKRPCDFCRRRRWFRRRRRKLQAPPEEEETFPGASSCGMQRQRTSSLRAAQEAEEAARVVLGRVAPGESLPLPYGWQRVGNELQLRPVVPDYREAGRSEPGSPRKSRHRWCQGASNGEHGVLLDELTDGATRLLSCQPQVASAVPPSGSSSSLGQGEAGGGEDALDLGSVVMNRLACWLSVFIDEDRLPVGQAAAARSQEHLQDWKLVVAPPLQLQNQLPVAAQFMIWEGDGARRRLRQSGIVAAGESAQVYSADLRASVSLQVLLDGYEWGEEEPVLISGGFSSHRAGTDGPQQLPGSFRITSPNQRVPLRVYLEREVDTGAAGEDSLDPGAAVAMGSPLTVRMFVPLWVANSTHCRVDVAVMRLTAAALESRLSTVGPDTIMQEPEPSDPSDSDLASVNDVLAVGMDLRELWAGRDAGLLSHAQVGAGSLELLSHPWDLRAGRASDAATAPVLAMQLGMRESGWSPALSLSSTSAPAAAGAVASSAAAASSSGSRRRLLLQQGMPALFCAKMQQGRLVEVVARLEVPEQMGFTRGQILKIEPHLLLSNRTGCDLYLAQAHGRRGRAPASPQLTFLPSGEVGMPMAWDSVSSGSAAPRPMRLLCADGQGPAPGQPGGGADGRWAPGWSQPFSWDKPGELYVVLPAAAAGPGDGRQRVVRLASDTPTPGSWHVVFQAVDALPPYLLQNRTLHALRYRQAGAADVAASGGGWRELPPLSAEGYYWEQPLAPRLELEVQEAAGRQPCTNVVLEEKAGTLGVQEAGQQPQPTATALRQVLEVGGDAEVVLLRVADVEEGVMHAQGLQALAGASEASSLGRTALDRCMIAYPRTDAASGDRLAPSGPSAAGSLELALDVAKVEVSVVDHAPEELILLTINGLAFQYVLGTGRGGRYAWMKASLEDMQLDDMLPNSSCPVLLYRSANGALANQRPRPLLTVSLVKGMSLRHGRLHLPFFSIDAVGTLSVAADEALVWRLLDLKQRLDAAAGAGAAGAGTAEQATDADLHIGLFTVSDVDALISFKPDPSARPRHASRFMQFGLNLADMDAVPFQLEGLERENFVTRQSVLLHAMWQRVYGEVMRFGLNVLSGYLSIKGTSKVFSNASKAIQGLAGSQPRPEKEQPVAHVGQGFLRGAGAIGQGVVRGITGVVAKPIEGAMASGTSGFLTGFRQGVLGVVAEPTSGVLDAASKVTEGVANTMTIGGGTPAMSRRRPQRCIGGDNRLMPYTLHDAAGQALLRGAAKKGRGLPSLLVSGVGMRSLDLSQDRYEEHFILPQSRIFTLTSRRVVMLHSQPFLNAMHAVNEGRSAAVLERVPAADIDWHIPWEDLLAVELSWNKLAAPGQPADRVVLHRVGAGIAQDPHGPPLYQVVKTRAGEQQAQHLKEVISATQRRYLRSEPGQRTAGWLQLRAAPMPPGQALPACMPSVRWHQVWRSGPSASQPISIWRAIGPEGYGCLGDVVKANMEEPGRPAVTVRDNSALLSPAQLRLRDSPSDGDSTDAGAAAASAAPTQSPPPGLPMLAEPIGFDLVWRDSGSDPQRLPALTLWRPVPPAGYCALGCVAVPAIAAPPVSRVRCLRRDLAVAAAAEPTPVFACASEDTVGWNCSLWRVANRCCSFLAVRSLTPPPPAVVFDLVPEPAEDLLMD